MMPHRPTLRSLSLTSGLSPTPNRCIFDYANAPSKSLASLGTSDMPRTLYEMPESALKDKLIYKNKLKVI